MTHASEDSRAALTAAYNRLLDTARELEAKIDTFLAFSSASSSELDRIEGRRFLMRMLGMAWDICVEHADPDHPRFHQVLTPWRKLFLDNPDTLYVRAPLRCGPGRAYLVRGHCKDPLYFSFVLYGRGTRPVDHLRGDEMIVGPDGSFSLWISTDPPEQEGMNWLKADPDAHMVQMRQYFHDLRSDPRIEPTIELVGGAPPPQPLSAEHLQQQILRAEKMMRGYFQRTIGVAAVFRQAPLNHFLGGAERDGINAQQLFPTPDNIYRLAWYRLPAGGALRIRGRRHKATYWNLSLVNVWLESYDFLHHTVSLNDSQIRLDSDGTYEIIVSERPQDHPNWLDTAGHCEGYIILRWLCLAEQPETPAITIV